MRNFINWGLFIALSLIWGSSFIMMKKGMVALSAYQVASLRILSSGIFMAPMLYNAVRRIPKDKVLMVLLSGILGSLLPAYLFCLAQTRVNSSMAGSLNALTPIFVLVVGALFFSLKTSLIRILGIILSFSGTLLLFYGQQGGSSQSDIFYTFLIVIATLSYGININLVNRHLRGMNSMDIAAMALFFIAIPALIYLWMGDFSQVSFRDPEVRVSIGFSLLLGILSTAIASVLYYMLIKRTGPVFSSTVTYGIPVVAIFWGMSFGEPIGISHLAGLILILAGVFLATRISAAREG
jgi:drug/metabolite transporter (DMT)-like permease